MTTDDDDELILKISRALDKAREECGKPDWTPLQAIVPADQMDGFMWMESFVDVGLFLAGSATRTFHVYKHGITRNCIIVDAETHSCWWYSDEMEAQMQVDTDAALDAVYDGLERAGATRTTAYDDKYRAERAARLAEMGIRTIY